MNSIVTSKGDYLANYFVDKNKGIRWELSSTESKGDKAINSSDTFIDRKSGKSFERLRSEVYKAAESGAIFLK